MLPKRKGELRSGVLTDYLGMALVLAALAAKGKSVIQNAQQIDRGYSNLEVRLQALGARIERI